MALWKLTVKNSITTNGIRIERGICVDVVSRNDPVSFNNGEAAREAFMRVYGIDLKKACALNHSRIDVKRQN